MRSSRRGAVEPNLTRNQEVAGSIPGLAQRVRDPALLWWDLDLTLLWLWCRPAAAAPIRPLAREPPWASGAALKGQKTKKKVENPKSIISKFSHSIFSKLILIGSHTHNT